MYVWANSCFIIMDGVMVNVLIAINLHVFMFQTLTNVTARAFRGLETVYREFMHNHERADVYRAQANIICGVYINTFISYMGYKLF